MTGLGDSASIAGQYGMSVSEETLRFIGVLELELELEIGLILYMTIVQKDSHADCSGSCPNAKSVLISAL
jgi:hypothetical protein